MDCLTSSQPELCSKPEKLVLIQHRTSRHAQVINWYPTFPLSKSLNGQQARSSIFSSKYFPGRYMYTIPCDLFPVLSPLWYVQKSYTFRKKRSSATFFFPPINLLCITISPCFSAKIAILIRTNTREAWAIPRDARKASSLLERKNPPSALHPWHSWY